ncbi:hypothetical protein NC661_17305 [Aquibacillus koreensis]|uniref:Phenylalanyl-tRNA synthetase subunit beta n=1 Tax=Aquibacillus koreensis TaxID=279446 RepID=A0A9X3WLZ2_9BACI|nr:hypothetical protein [Aquibacillus koreensis]MCT2536196.1 hypothetical protein [Aquibacillus koreensis]MDC3422120.1 hypothetical protein [Aquibacillus koreensis]
MKLLRRLFVFCIVIAGIGYAVYHFGTNLVADKVAEQVDMQLGNETQFEQVKQIIEQDATLSQFVREGATIKEDSLPFHTKEEAMKEIVKKLSFSDMQEMQSTVEDGITTEEQQELINKLTSKLSAEELDAVKVILYKEMNKQ